MFSVGGNNFATDAPPRMQKGASLMSLTKLVTRSRDEEDGFTLIELMVVVLIIAILIAIAIPTFLGARQRAQDRAAQSDLRNGLTAEKTYYTDTQEYTNVTADLTAIESALDWGGDLTVVVGSTSVAPAGTTDMVCLQQQSKSGTIFSLVDIAAGTNAGTYYGKVACGAASEAGWSALGSSW
jgi:type IV pilus assembly protein PilA